MSSILQSHPNVISLDNPASDLALLTSIDIFAASRMAMRLDVFGKWYDTLTSKQKHELCPNLS